MVFEKIRAIIAEQLGIAESSITMQTSLVDDLGADSLDIVSLIMAIEEEFGIEFDEADAEKFSTVGDAVDYISEHC